jgi:spermidine/putrescine transport system substrate-binding protein
MKPKRVYLTPLAVLGVAFAAGCGSGDDETSVAPAPAEASAEASGTLRVFAYGDSLVPEMIDPFKQANPDVDLQTATFNSNKAAAAKLAGGFEADVVEVCVDEMEPLVARQLLRPIDPEGVKDFDELAIADSPDIRSADDEVLLVPTSAGPHGLIVNTAEAPGATSYADLFDPAYAGNAAIEGSSLTAIGVTAMALGMDDPMNLTPEQIEEVKNHLLDNRDQFRDFPESDASMANLFKSGEAVIADGGRGTAKTITDDQPEVEWVAPDEGVLSWVCGMAITSNAENIDAAYEFINYYASPETQAESARQGYVAMNPKAIPLLGKGLREAADPASLEDAIPETQPDNEDAYSRAWQEVSAG